MTPYSGAWAIMPTPYTPSLEIDVPAYRALIEWYVAQISAVNPAAGGLYANCQTSEMFDLNPEERLLLAREALRVSRGRLPVAATANFGPSVGEHIAFCRRMAATGVDIVMLVVPEFIRDDAELETYLFEIAAQVEARLGLYECPVPRSYHLGVDLVGKLARSGRFFAFKETSCELEKIRELARVCAGASLAYLQANTPYLLEAAQAGAPGTMSIAAGFAPRLTAQVVELARRGDPQAAELHDQLCAMELAERVIHPVGMKYLLARQGLPFSTAARGNRPQLSAEALRALDSCARVWF